jgi:hypothetical protein
VRRLQINRNGGSGRLSVSREEGSGRRLHDGLGKPFDPRRGKNREVSGERKFSIGDQSGFVDEAPVRDHCEKPLACSGITDDGIVGLSVAKQ